MKYSEVSPAKPLGRYVPNPKLRFMDQCREVLRFKQMSGRTEESYLDWIRRFILFHREPTPSPSKEGNGRGWRHPRDLGAAEVQEYLSHLASDSNSHFDGERRLLAGFGRENGENRPPFPNDLSRLQIGAPSK